MGRGDEAVGVAEKAAGDAEVATGGADEAPRDANGAAGCADIATGGADEAAVAVGSGPPGDEQAPPEYVETLLPRRSSAS